MGWFSNGFRRSITNRSYEQISREVGSYGGGSALFAVAIAAAVYPNAKYGSEDWDQFNSMLPKPDVDPAPARQIVDAWIDHHQMSWSTCVTRLYGCEPTELMSRVYGVDPTELTQAVENDSAPRSTQYIDASEINKDSLSPDELAVVESGAVINRVIAECAAALRNIPGIDSKQAQETAESMAQKAYEQAIERTNDVYKEGNGKSLLTRELTDAKMHAAFEKRRQEGVTNTDICWWWDMSVFEQEVLLQQDNFNRFCLYSFLTEDKGLDGSKALAEVWKCHPKLGTPEDGGDDNRCLPLELKRRITNYMLRHYGDPQTLKAKIESSTSFNALIRKELRAGTL